MPNGEWLGSERYRAGVFRQVLVRKRVEEILNAEPKHRFVEAVAHSASKRHSGS